MRGTPHGSLSYLLEFSDKIYLEMSFSFSTGLMQKNSMLAAVARRPLLTASVVLFAFALLLYALTMAPGLTWENEGGDGGDFLAAAHTWGIPHPTGYPTYIVLLRGFSEIVWFGDEASKANLFSAIVGAIAVPFFFLAARKMLLRLPLADTRGTRLPFAVAFVTALAFATANLHWSQSTITEVYALNALFVGIFLWLSFIARARIEQGQTAVGIRAALALLLGFSFGNHVTIAFVAVPFGVWLYWPLLRRDAKDLLTEWQPVVGLLLGLAVYAYAPIASLQDPPLNWFFPDSFGGFRSMASASLYQPYVFGLQRDFIDDRVIATFDIWLTQFTALGAILGIAGITFLWTRLNSFAIAGVGSFLSLVIYSVAYNSFDSYVFLIPAFMVFGLWVAAGLLNLIVSILAAAEQREKGWLHRQRTRVVPALVTAAVIGIPLWSIAFNYGGVDISDDTEAQEFMDTAFESAGQGAVIIAEDIPTFGLWYQSLVVEPEQDVAIIATFLLGFDWYWEHIQRQFPERIPQEDIIGFNRRLQQIVAHNFGTTSVFLVRDDASYSSRYSLVEDGVLWRVTG